MLCVVMQQCIPLVSIQGVTAPTAGHRRELCVCVCVCACVWGGHGCEGSAGVELGA